MNKIKKIILTLFRGFAMPVFSFLLSVIGVRLYGKEFWGEFVFVYAWIILFAFLANFGNKDYLLRKYSENPSQINVHFNTSLFSRTVLVSFSLILLLFLPSKIAFSSILLIILLFLYQSFESLVIYYQLFLAQLIAEIIGFVILLTYFIYFETLYLQVFLHVFSLSVFIKTLIVLYALRNKIKLSKIRFSFLEIKSSLPFFLIIFSGFLASKIDVYIITILMPRGFVSQYQIGITSFLLLQSISYLLILPFNKHLYRINRSIINKIKNKLAILSIPIICVGTIFIWLILEKIALLNLPLLFYVFGAVSTIPTYFFIIDIIILYRNKRENLIMKINFFAALLHIILTYILILYFGILGGVISVFIVQFTLLTLYKKYICL